MDPKPVNHTSRNSQPFVFVPKSLFLRQKLPIHHFWQKIYQQVAQRFIFGPFSPRKNVSFLDLFPAQNMSFLDPKIHCQSVQKKNSFGTKLDLNQPKTRGKCLLIEPNRFFSKRFRKDSSDNGLISNKMTNICFFMFGWKTNQWDPASELNDFVSQASKKVLLWLQTLYLSRPGL